MAYMNQERKAALAPAIKKVLAKYKMKGTIAVRNHLSLQVNLKSGPIKFDPREQVNVYWIDSHYEGVARKFLNELLAAMKGTVWYDNSDAQIDYFDTAYYIDINVGKYNKDYVYTP